MRLRATADLDTREQGPIPERAKNGPLRNVEISERYRSGEGRTPRSPMQADVVIIIAIFALATAGRLWGVVAGYRRSVRRLREQRRQYAEAELFERLERCMQSDRVD